MNSRPDNHSDDRLAHAETLDAATVVASPGAASTGPDSGDGRATRKRIALVQGGTPHMSAETRDLLRGRLRVTALLLFAGFTLFLIKGVFTPSQYAIPLGQAVFWAQVAVTALAGLIGARLCRHCDITITKLRVAEVLVFGAPAAFFVLLDYVRMNVCAERGFVQEMSGHWIVLIFLYAMFIPNTWRRAACVLGAIAALPLITLAVNCSTSAACRAVMRDPDFTTYPIELAMTLSICVVAAVVGVHSIRSLRRQAFEARQLGQYRLKQLIGAGGMGEVYLAEHTLLKRPCAVKVIRPEKAGESRVLARFEREVRAMAKLSHWNTVEVFDYGNTEQGVFYYAMEYLPGLSLAQLVEMFGPMPAERVIYLLAQACDALSEAHEKGFIHRDLKPGNIFAAYRGGVYDVAKLLDFGLAKPLTDANSTNLTVEGSITGSPLFMSPEQATGDHEPSVQSDIYALGGVAYYLLTGRPPFDSARPLKVIMAHAHEPVDPPSKVRDGVPDDLERIVLRCLEKQPEDRFRSAAELREALLECDASGLWTRETARVWWSDYGCPKKKALDSQALAAAGV